MYERLTKELQAGKHVLWLVTGGSSMAVAVGVMQGLPDAITRGLTVMLTDERYGPVGHPDSNYKQYQDLGMQPKQARFVPVLRPDLPLEDTVKQYANDFQIVAGAADTIIGMFGIGTDGHIAGALPGSAAISSGDLTFGYESPPFTRVTLTPKAISQINVAYAYAFGDTKKEQLTRLHDENLTLDVQPAQILKQLPEAFVFNDQIEDLRIFK
jgi:6-phosphogluconolactonase/glucosamine-6-phosphate isomerase/deaminase